MWFVRIFEPMQAVWIKLERPFGSWQAAKDWALVYGGDFHITQTPWNK